MQRKRMVQKNESINKHNEKDMDININPRGDFYCMIVTVVDAKQKKSYRNQTV